MKKINLTNCFICNDLTHISNIYIKYSFCDKCGLFYYYEKKLFRWHHSWEYKFFYLREIMPKFFSKEYLEKIMHMTSFI